MMTPGSYKDKNAPEWPISMRWFQYAIEHYGVPTALLLICGYWFSTHIAEPLVRSHIQFLDREVESSSALHGMEVQALKNHGLLLESQKIMVENQRQTMDNDKKQLEILDTLGKFCGRSDTSHERQEKKLDEIGNKITTPAQVKP